MAPTPKIKSPDVVPGLAGKVVVVTGASDGIGAGVARFFAAQGMRLGLCSRRPPVLPDGPAVLARSVDVSDEAAVNRFADEVAARFGAIDLWINNAGILQPVGPLRTLDMTAFKRTHEVNFMGLVYGARAFIAHVRAGPEWKKRHRIDDNADAVLINLSSAAARLARPGLSAYSSSKAAIDRLTEAVAAEERDAGIRVYALSPGMVDGGTQALSRSMPVALMPTSDNNRRAAELGTFNTPEHVARHMLAIAFDPAARPEGWLHVVPNQH